MSARRFPPPWTVEEQFAVRDRDGQALAYVYFDDPRAAAKPVTRDDARRIAANIAKLPDRAGLYTKEQWKQTKSGLSLLNMAVAWSRS